MADVLDVPRDRAGTFCPIIIIDAIVVKNRRGPCLAGMYGASVLKDHRSNNSGD